MNKNTGHSLGALGAYTVFCGGLLDAHNKLQDKVVRHIKKHQRVLRERMSRSRSSVYGAPEKGEGVYDNVRP